MHKTHVSWLQRNIVIRFEQRTKETKERAQHTQSHTISHTARFSGKKAARMKRINNEVQRK